MNEFANLLSAFVKEKGVKIQPFARYCGYDRANMYKILKGQRNIPGREIVEKAVKYMHLLPSEEEKLWEAYEISAQGSDNYYRRKEVQKFFTEPILSSNVNITALTEGEPAKFGILNNESIPLRGGYEIDAALFRLIGEESRNKDGHLRLMIQPESNSLSSILSVHGNYACNTRIDHIVCLSSNPENVYRKKNYNLDCLRCVLPLYNYNYDYNTWYYYSKIPVQEKKFGLFPYMVLSSKYACVLTADMQKGYITAKPEILRICEEIFEECLKESKPMIRRLTDLDEQFEVTGKILKNKDQVQSFQMTPCLTPVLTEQIYEKYLKKELPGREKLIQTLYTYGEEIKRSDIQYVTSLEGIKRFLKTGIISEWPPELYDPLEMDDRIQLIKDLIFSDNGINIRILKKTVGNFDAEIYLCVSREYGILKFIVPEKQMQLHLVLEETGLLFSFFDFCENLSTEQIFSSSEEIESFLENWQLSEKVLF